jgi:hypothetical protein
MPDFYVSWMKPIKRARIHTAECSNCNSGNGQAGQDKTGSGNTGWHGPFSFEGAQNRAEKLRREGFTDVDYCGTCLRSHRSGG